MEIGSLVLVKSENGSAALRSEKQKSHYHSQSEKWICIFLFILVERSLLCCCCRSLSSLFSFFFRKIFQFSPQPFTVDTLSLDIRLNTPTQESSNWLRQSSYSTHSNRRRPGDFTIFLLFARESGENTKPAKMSHVASPTFTLQLFISIFCNKKGEEAHRQRARERKERRNYHLLRFY